MAEEKNQEQNLSQLLQIRRDKLKELQGGGRDPFQITKYEVTHDSAAIKALMDDLWNRRRHKQPLDVPSAGSTFKRPKGYFAAALIDECKLKGVKMGGAQVSTKHAGFLINAGGATCDDVLRLAESVRETVRRETGVELELEVRTLGV